VDPSKVVATLDDGTLKITLPKIVMKKAAQADRSQTIISE
jgi:HSP20 family molecular chaperone IbpA